MICSVMLCKNHVKLIQQPAYNAISKELMDHDHWLKQIEIMPSKDAACVAYGCLAHWAVQKKLHMFPLRPKLHVARMHFLQSKWCVFFHILFEFSLSTQGFQEMVYYAVIERPSIAVVSGELVLKKGPIHLNHPRPKPAVHAHFQQWGFQWETFKILGPSNGQKNQAIWKTHVPPIQLRNSQGLPLKNPVDSCSETLLLSTFFPWCWWRGRLIRSIVIRN